MPEEINRIVTDAVSDYLFTPSPDADANLLREGVAQERIFRVGNVMIDSVVHCLPAAERSPILNRLGLRRPHGRDSRMYLLVTLHRPGNVDVARRFRPILDALVALSQETTVVWPVHPRARGRLAEFELTQRIESCSRRMILTEPVGYVDFLALERSAALVITDSGGIQEETTYLGVPCLTVRENTERPITITQGTNTLVAADTSAIVESAQRALATSQDLHPTIPLWDGHAGVRIIASLRDLLMAGHANF